MITLLIITFRQFTVAEKALIKLFSSSDTHLRAITFFVLYLRIDVVLGGLLLFYCVLDYFSKFKALLLMNSQFFLDLTFEVVRFKVCVLIYFF